jgi:hypothetical protein
MPTLTAALLDAWEQAGDQRPGARALTLLAAGEPQTPRDVLGRLSAGARDRRLLQLRERLFGQWLSSVVDCPLCGEALEFELTVGELLLSGPDPDPQEEHEAWDGDLHLRFRLPDSAQLEQLKEDEPHEALRTLRQACVLRLERQGTPLAVQDSPPEVWALLDREMAALDPQAQLELNLSCPACAHTWAAPFDVGRYLWAEVRAWGEGVLTDVHELALAYGWAEPEILTLSPSRRQRYLELLRG